MSQVEASRNLSATLYVHCKDSARKEVIDNAQEFKQVVRAWKVDPNHRGHHAEVIVELKVKDSTELASLAYDLYFKVKGVIAIQPTIEVKNLE